jgi:hypothetical protein
MNVFAGHMAIFRTICIQYNYLQTYFYLTWSAMCVVAASSGVVHASVVETFTRSMT